MSENKTTPNVKPFALPNGMTLMDYFKSNEFKERIRKAREEWQQKHKE